MNYIDFAIASSAFLIFFGVILIFSTNYFSNLSNLVKTSEFRSVSEIFFRIFFESKGVPENWKKNYLFVPVKIGLAEDLYVTSILIKETNGSSRTNEPVMAQIVFDENCQNKSWNNTVRMYDEDWNQINLEVSNTTFCSSQYSNQTNVTWSVNISANQNKKYYIYYSPDDDVISPNYITLTYNTSSWIPSDGDSWTETTTDWSRYGGYSGTVTNDTVNKMKGNTSVNITDIFNSDYLGLKYDPAQSIMNISNDWYLDTWLYLDSAAQLSYFYVNLSDSNGNSIHTNILPSVTDNLWYHFVKPLEPSQWIQSGYFNASTGIDKIVFYLTNSTSGLTRTLKVDNLHFRKKPLEVKTFPEEKITAVSGTKFNALKNISYDEARKTVGENYKFRLEVGNETYGGNINMSTNVGCSEYPKIIEKTNGNVSKTLVKVCVWK